MHSTSNLQFTETQRLTTERTAANHFAKAQEGLHVLQTLFAQNIVTLSVITCAFTNAWLPVA